MGKAFHIETDHKPIVPPLGTKDLDEMPPRIQRLRMRLLRFDFTISHVPGKEHTTADALSRTPSESTSRVKQEEEIELYVESILLQLPTLNKRLEEIATAQSAKSCLRIVRRDGQTRLKSFQARSVHTGIQETRFPRDKDFFSKALVSLLRHRLDWKSWTGFTMGIKELSNVVAEPRHRFVGQGKQLEEMVTNCHKCIEHQKPNRESVISSAVPERPWQVLETDLFSLNERTYLLLVDYFSHFIEVSVLLASQKVKRYAHQSPYSLDTEYPISSGLTMDHNWSQRDSTSSQRITRSHM